MTIELTLTAFSVDISPRDLANAKGGGEGDGWQTTGRGPQVQ